MTITKPDEICDNCHGRLRAFRDARGTGLYCLGCGTIWETQRVPLTKIGREYTPGMIEAQAHFDRPLDEVIPQLINLLGTKRAAIELGTNRSNLYYWCKVLGLQYRMVAWGPDEEVKIIKKGVKP